MATEHIQKMRVFWSHGTKDRNVPNELKLESVAMLRALSREGLREEHMYDKMHQMCEQEAEDLRGWLERVLFTE